MRSRDNLVRKQYLVSKDNVQKLEKLAHLKGTSAAEIVRNAIDAYDPRDIEDMTAPDLMELVSAQLKATLAATKKTNQKVAKALKLLSEFKS